MKKTLLVAALAGLAFASCKKQYDCECTFTSTITINGTAQPSTVSTVTTKTEKLSKSDATSQCEGFSTTQTSGTAQNGSKVVSTCAIK